MCTANNCQHIFKYLLYISEDTSGHMEIDYLGHKQEHYKYLAGICYFSEHDTLITIS